MKVGFRLFTVYHDTPEGRALRLFRRANRLYRGVKRAQKTRQPSDHYETRLREALSDLHSAMNWAEADGDQRLFDQVHSLLHQVGRYTSHRFGCWIRPSDGSYRQTCPVALAHKRIGLSPTIVVTRICSLCAQDAELCVHIDGRSYDGRVCRFEANPTTISEMSIVGIPRMPDSRLDGIELSVAELEAHLGPRWLPGTRISCDACLKVCEGFDKYDAASMGVPRTSSVQTDLGTSQP